MRITGLRNHSVKCFLDKPDATDASPSTSLRVFGGLPVGCGSQRRTAKTGSPPTPRSSSSWSQPAMMNGTSSDRWSGPSSCGTR